MLGLSCDVLTEIPQLGEEDQELDLSKVCVEWRRLHQKVVNISTKSKYLRCNKSNTRHGRISESTPYLGLSLIL
jgi:hypothetical protein